MMNVESSTSLCRICLKDGATIPLFEETGTQGDNVHSKLCLCVCEKVENIEGYPNNICTSCNNTLDSLVKFINKYKESRKILQNGLVVVKKVNINNFWKSADEEVPEVEREIIDIKNIKTEIDNRYDDNISDIEDTVPLKNIKTKRESNKNIVITVETQKVQTENRQNTVPLRDIKTKQQSDKNCVKSVKTQKVKTKKLLNANKLASSILEGDFLWNGEKWCLKIGQTTVRKTVKQEPQVKKPQPQAKKPQPQVKKPQPQFKKSQPQVKKSQPQVKKQQPQKNIRVPETRSSSDESKLCDICGETCNNSSHLASHKLRVHNKTLNQCPKCPKICSTEYDLRNHTIRVHSALKNFICSICGKGFPLQGQRTSHIKKVHEKHLQPKKMFTCKFCGKIYKCPKSVIVHERSVHTGYKPAECAICSSKFSHIDYLKEHMRLHTGERPFKCPICGKGYTQRSNMKSHLRIHKLSELTPITMSKLKPNYLKLLKP